MMPVDPHFLNEFWCVKVATHWCCSLTSVFSGRFSPFWRVKVNFDNGNIFVLKTLQENVEKKVAVLAVNGM